MTIETIAGWTLFTCAAIRLATDRLIAAVCWLDMRDQRRLAAEADDWGEPSRAQVEWEQHIAEAVALTETPIYAALDREQFANGMRWLRSRN